MDIYLMGYSIRIVKEDPDWDENRKKTFLINPGISIPKSVDDNVWAQYRPSLSVTALGEIPRSFWMDHSEMMKTTNYCMDDYGLVKLTAYLHIFDNIPAEFLAMDYKPTNIDKNLYFLGYDIADEAPYSGLSNCAYTKDESNYCREKYLPYLNQHGLFEDFNIALDFKTYTDNRVSGHCPFYIYSLYTDKLII